jgi:hypothetical protein
MVRPEAFSYMPIDTPRILFKVTLTDKHKPTGRTVHTSDGRLLDTPKGQTIAQFHDDPGFYLYHLDSNGKEQTDTYHSTIEQAKGQATYEFGVQEADWQQV